MTHVTKACIGVLDQLETAIAELAPHDFKRSSTVLGGASIGQHVRHTIEFFDCLALGHKSGIVNYDNRAHDKEIETDQALALSAIRAIRGFVEGRPSGKSLLLQVDYTGEGATSQLLETTFLRELAYNLEHVIHHMAIIKIGIMDVAPYVILPAHFGMAASTVRHLQAEAMR